MSENSAAREPSAPSGATTLPLVMEEPRGRRKPPRHLADLDPAERKALLESQGLPGYRAAQVSRHYFSRLVDDPEQMTDLPAGQRGALVEALVADHQARLLAAVGGEDGA